MLAAFEKLRKMLVLEQNQGHQDQAVIGGLSSFSERWRHEALAETGGEEHAERITAIADGLADYAGLDEAARRQRLAHVLELLAQDVQEHLSGRSDRPENVRLPSPHKPTPRGPATPSEDESRPPAKASGPPPATDERQALGLRAPVTTLPGISVAYSARLKRLGIETVEDLLYHFPHRYEDYSALKPISRLEYGDETTIIGVIWKTTTRQAKSGATIVKSLIRDASGSIEATWFNQPYLASQLRAGRRIVLSGKVGEYLGKLSLQSPAWEPLERELIHTGRLVPIYPLTRGVTSRWMRRMTKRVVDHWAPRLQDPLPEQTRRHRSLVDLSTALAQIHFPDSQEAAADARRRLSFDEFMAIQLGVMRKRFEWQSREGVPIPRDQHLVEGFLSSLPFQLTGAQSRSLEQVMDDLSGTLPMTRLIQGDVGSGKTVVAAAAMLMVVASGRQATLMAPTELLAEQHFETITGLLAESRDWPHGREITVELLTGSLNRVQRGQVYTAMASGQADIVVGTHALIQQHVTFRDLALVIVDEQHRFGVSQRAALRGKGAVPHVLVMSATPIPRSLALTLYGDLDVSVIDQMPPGRQPIHTRWLVPRERERAYTFIDDQIEKGRQAFILYPLIEDSEKIDAKSAVAEYERLQATVFQNRKLGLVHGNMKASEKDEVMARFRAGELHILVSTSVIEVGIDVPNATVMLIEGADRFGLAQLHQFRGRVGRGEHQSYCLLLSDVASPDDPQTHATWERLKAIEKTDDGFELAEKDLELRGPGDFFGVRQSGLPALRLASLSNIRILEEAREEALMLFEKDPMLREPQHQLLAEQVERAWLGHGDLS